MMGGTTKLGLCDSCLVHNVIGRGESMEVKGFRMRDDNGMGVYTCNSRQ